MRTFLFVLTLMLFTMPVFAQDKDKDKSDYIFVKDEASGDYYFEEVVPVDGITKDVLYDRAKKWITANLKTADNNIDANDKEFTIVNSAAIKVDRKLMVGLEIHEGYFDFKLRVWCKDGKYKVRVDNVMYYVIIEQSGGFAEKGMKPRTYAYSELENNKMGKYLKKQANEKIASLLNVMKNSVVKGTETKNDNDW